jgi:hypothetical protein
MPYPKLISGPGNSIASVYRGAMLISNDEGNTWSDSGITVDGKLDLGGFGGCMEPGIFQKGSKLTYYFRTTVGAIYAVDLTYTGGIYSAGSAYHIGLKAQNAMSSIKYLAKLDLFVAVYTRLNGDPRSYDRKNIDLSTSRDGNHWTLVSQIASAERDGVLVNEPTIFIDDQNDQIISHFSKAPQNSYYDLLSKKIPYILLANTPPTNNEGLITVATNPTGGDTNSLGEASFNIDSYGSNTAGNRTRSNLLIKGEVTDTITGVLRTFYNVTNLLTVKGEANATSDSLDISKLSNQSNLILVDGVHIRQLSQYTSTHLKASNVKNGAVIDEYIVFHIDRLTDPEDPVNGEVKKKWGYRSDSPDDQSAHMGNFGFGVMEPTEKVDVDGGNVKADSIILKIQARPALPKTGQTIINSFSGAIEYYNGTIWKKSDGTNA